jgi:hypothetical protein
MYYSQLPPPETQQLNFSFGNKFSPALNIHGFGVGMGALTNHTVYHLNAATGSQWRYGVI